MAFHSFDYLVFLIAVLAGYWWLPRRVQNVLLIAAGYMFYGWVHPWYGLLLAITTLIDFSCARGIAATTDCRRRRRFVALSLVTNFTSLGFFKYFGFLTQNVTALLATTGLMSSAWTVKILLPAGISFFTFQNIAYVIDVYRGRTEARKSLLDYACFASFFPQLVAGPIERADHLLKQVEAPRRADFTGLRCGLVLIFWGLFEKLVIADSAALLADKVFSIRDAAFPVLWGGVVAFGVQIYADFSAYTDIARGSARLLGIELRENFNHPYLAQSPPEFWRRWHMSLSNWFRDYVYIPLGGSRAGPKQTARNLIITFFLSGLWHGASWNFVLWGLFHGVLVAGWPALSKRLPFVDRGGGWVGAAFRVGLTFVLVHIGWLMFREHTLAGLARGFSLNPANATASDWRLGSGLAVESLLYGLPLLVVLPIIERLGAPQSNDPKLLTWRWTLAQGLAVAVCLLGTLALRCSTGSDFIYFQF